MQTWERTNVFYQTSNMKVRPQEVVQKNVNCSSRSFLLSGNIISCSYIAFSVIFQLLSVKSYAPILIKSAFIKGKSILKCVSNSLPSMDSVLLEYCAIFILPQVPIMLEKLVHFQTVPIKDRSFTWLVKIVKSSLNNK